jgi:hypothetical protein
MFINYNGGEVLQDTKKKGNSNIAFLLFFYLRSFSFSMIARYRSISFSFK